MTNPIRVHRMRHTDDSRDPRYGTGSLPAVDGDSHFTAAPGRLLDWVHSTEETQELYSAGHRTTPDLIYARGVLDSPHSDPTSFNKKLCTLIVVEIGFCRDLGCGTKIETKTKKYSPLIAVLNRYW